MSKDKDLSRIRSDSIWNSLPPERRATFEGWLFEEHVSYATARERAKTEWGVEGSLSSVGKYARRVARRRAVTDLEELTAAATEVDDAEGKLARMKGSAMKLVGMQLLEKALMRGDIKELAALSRVLTQVEDREIQRGRLELQREKFEFKAAEAALKEAPVLNRIQQEKQKRKDAEIVEARLAIFGRPPPGYPDPCRFEERAEGQGIKKEKLKIKNGDRARRSNEQGRMPQRNDECQMTNDKGEVSSVQCSVFSKKEEKEAGTENATVAGSGVVTPEHRIRNSGNQERAGNVEREDGGPSGRATRVVDGTIPYEQEQRAVGNVQREVSSVQCSVSSVRPGNEEHGERGRDAECGKTSEPPRVGCVNDGKGNPPRHLGGYGGRRLT